jgi:hypothetical protein
MCNVPTHGPAFGRRSEATRDRAEVFGAAHSVAEEAVFASYGIRNVLAREKPRDLRLDPCGARAHVQELRLLLTTARRRIGAFVRSSSLDERR